MTNMASPKKTEKHVLSEPKQSRSRASLERILKATGELLVERGYSGFTLQDVSKRGNASIGSIYNRFSGKDDLIRKVQEREFIAMDQETAVLVNDIRRRQLRLRQLVPTLVKEFAEFLASHRKMLRALMEVAATDIEVAKSGKAFYGRVLKDFELLLLDRKEEIIQPNPSQAVDLSFRLVYGAIARHMGLGTVEENLADEAWEALLNDLSRVMLHYLLSHPDQLVE